MKNNRLSARRRRLNLLMTRAARGITLIELIVVMAILSVLLAFVGPSASAGIDNLRLSSEARSVLSGFRLAQTNARNNGERVFAIYDEESVRFLQRDSVYQTLNMPRDIKLIPSAKTDTLLFLESGQIVGPETVDLMNTRGRHAKLSIDQATGSIKLLDSH